MNYCSSTRMDGIRGILLLDKPVGFYSVSDPTKLLGTVTLRRLLFKYVKMSGGFGLFEELHQAMPLSVVDVAVTNCKEAERMISMIHKHSAAFFWYYLQSKTELGNDLIASVIWVSMDPILVNWIDWCKWDSKKWLFSTPEDADLEKLKAMEEGVWYRNKFGDHMVDMSKKEKAAYANKEALDELHCDHSFKSIHHRKGNYMGSPYAELFQVGSKGKPVELDEEEEGEYTNMSPAELIAMLKKHNISLKGTVVSPPISKWSGSVSDDEDELISSSSSASSGSNSVSLTGKATSTPSAGVGTTVREPVQGE